MDEFPILIPRRRVSEITGLQRSALYRRIADFDFPAPVRIGSAGVRWIESEVVEWVERQIELSREPVSRTKSVARRRSQQAKHAPRF